MVSINDTVPAYNMVSTGIIPVYMLPDAFDTHGAI